MKIKDLAKRIAAGFLAMSLTFGVVSFAANEPKAAEEEVKAVWFTYMEVAEYLKDKSESQFEASFSKVCDNLVDNKINTIYVHVRAFSDSIYPSSYYPWSTRLTSSGRAPAYDPLQKIVEIAHARGIKVHAWVNPYRIATSVIDSKNPDKGMAVELYNGKYSNATLQSKVSEWKRKNMITLQEYAGSNYLCLDPGKEDARKLVVNGIKEIVNNYDVDGVIFDDYFYVWDYYNSNNATSERTQRMNNVNLLIKDVYSAVKAAGSNKTFGISPMGDIAGAKKQGCDLDKWLSQSGYIDYIAPQLYWADNYYHKSSETYKDKYTEDLKAWKKLIKNDVKLYPALAMYKAADNKIVDSSWGKETNWADRNSNILEQWTVAYKNGCKGFSLYRYDDILRGNGPTEMANLNGENVAFKVDGVSVSYQTHVQNIGWMDSVRDGALSGTEGRSLRMEAIRINVNTDGIAGDITYRTHVQNIGWTDWSKNGKDSGTTGSSKRLEAIEIKLTGDLADRYDVYYRVHAQNYGWLDWAKNGETAGTTGKSKRLEAIQIVLVNKGGEAPGPTTRPCVETLVKYDTHVQNIGWQDSVSDGVMAGTEGRSLRLEGIHIKLVNQKYSGSIEYRVHCQKVGWTDFVKDGEMAGTEGRSLRLEAIEIKLSGEIAEHYDVVYRVHCQNYGWMDWKSNGEMAGTEGESKRLEGIEIKLVPKN